MHFCSLFLYSLLLCLMKKERPNVYYKWKHILPGSQIHLYCPIWSRHIALFIKKLLLLCRCSVPVERSTHLLYTHEHTNKFSPVRPGGHIQENDPTLSRQVDPSEQAASWQSSMFSLQSSPVQPFTHLQKLPPLVVRHVPPFWHTCWPQTTPWHWGPTKPKKKRRQREKEWDGNHNNDKTKAPFAWTKMNWT